MNAPRILIAGIGNIFLGDDAFGVEVAQRMLHEPPREGVRVVDFGIRGMDLTYALLEDYDAAIMVDAVPRGEAAGTLYLIAPDPGEMDAATSEPSLPGEMLVDAHSMDPMKVLRLVRAMGGGLGRILLVGCEPTPFDPETELEITLSAPVREAVPRAVDMLHALIEKLQTETDVMHNIF